MKSPWSGRFAIIRSLSTSRQALVRIHAKIRKQELVMFYCRKTILLAIQRAWVQAITFKHDTRYTCKIPIYVVEFCQDLSSRIGNHSFNIVVRKSPNTACSADLVYCMCACFVLWLQNNFTVTLVSSFNLSFNTFARKDYWIIS